MAKQPFFERIKRSSAKRADTVLSIFGMPDRLPVATHDRSYRAWVRNNGDETHRLDYRLDAADIVFDVGGYQGDWTAEIDEKFGSQIHVFEPIRSYSEKITERFADHSNVHSHCCGLSAKDETISLSILDDSTSQFKQSKNSEACKLRSVSEFLTDYAIDKVALLKLNIEGGEYELLEHLIETGLISRFGNIQVQFHWFVPNARIRMAAIQDSLRKTHDVTFQYPFVWENWTSTAA